MFELTIKDIAKMKNHIRDIFKECIKSVLPRNIIKNTIKLDSQTLFVKDDKFNIPENIYVVGFGKAVLDMALEVEKILDGFLKKAVLSVPFGAGQIIKNSKICVMEAAKNNMPDQYAVENTECIKDTIKTLKDNDMLIVLISGGGSALLCSPTVPLVDKVYTTSLLASQGATIEQLNSVRKALSSVKGGKLINYVNKKSTVISLILSDIIGDPLSAIASGPTVPNSDSNDLPLAVIERLNLLDKIPSTVMNVLKENKSFNSIDFKSVHNYIIGNNTIALKTGTAYAKNDYISMLLTKSLQGNVTVVSKFYSDLILFICDLYSNNEYANNAFKNQLMSNIDSICSDIDIGRLICKVFEASSDKRGVCILSGGEPTVNVRGSGLGGRNQELALRVSMHMEKQCDLLKQFDVVFFSGGTDGIDGPTDACGAFGYPELVKMAQFQGFNPLQFVENNDSYGFYSVFNGGEELLKIGHTGTNVMDVHVLIIKLK